MLSYSSTRARELFSEVITQSGNEPVFIERRGKVEAVVVSAAEYTRMRDALDEKEDVELFDQALAEEGDNIPWDAVKADLGWE
jgi:antitoxin Phd